MLKSNLWRRFAPAWFVAAMCCFPGCEKVSEIAENVQKQAENLNAGTAAGEQETGPAKPEAGTGEANAETASAGGPAATESSAASTSATTDNSNEKPMPAPPPAADPAAVVAGFLQVSPRDRNDAQFLTLQDLPADSLATITDVVIASPEVTAAGLAVLQKCPQLARLELNAIPIGDEMLACVAKLTQLQALALPGCQFAEEGILQLAELKQLQDLNLDSTNLTDAGLVVISQLPELEVLNLSHTQVTGMSLAGKPKLAKLRVLNVSQTQYSVGLGYFKGLASLEELDAKATPLDDQSLAKGGGGWVNLKKLSLAQTNVGDLGFKAAFSASKKLEDVNLFASRVGNPTFGVLVNCKNLKFVQAVDTNVTIQAGAALKQRLPDAEVNW